MTSVADKLKEKLSPLKPLRLEVVDESHRHIGHAGNPDGRGETHFTLEIVSGAFAGKSRLQRHRLVMDLVQPIWLETGLHALSLRLYAPDENTSS
jgi:BolA protein